MCDDNDVPRAEERRCREGSTYKESTRATLDKACSFFCQQDYFTAYQCLFIGFNNYYSWIDQFSGNNPKGIRKAICRLPNAGFYTDQYVENIRKLNDGIPQEIQSSNEARPGILDMQKFFQGKSIFSVVRHVDNIAAPNRSEEAKRETLKKVATELLWTVRNNQFHAIKSRGVCRDTEVLCLAYNILRPIANALINDDSCRGLT